MSNENKEKEEKCTALMNTLHNTGAFTFTFLPKVAPLKPLNLNRNKPNRRRFFYAY